jgi:hypothetical protein
MGNKHHLFGWIEPISKIPSKRGGGGVSRVFLRWVLWIFALSLFGSGCSHHSKKHLEEPPPPDYRKAEDTGGSAGTGSDFSPEYRQQVEDADKDAELQKQTTKRRDKRLDENINRSDRREKQ